MKDFHVTIIGGGVVGSTIAWELSKYNLEVAVLEKGSDVNKELIKVELYL